MLGVTDSLSAKRDLAQRPKTDTMSAKDLTDLRKTAQKLVVGGIIQSASLSDERLNILECLEEGIRAALNHRRAHIAEVY